MPRRAMSEAAYEAHQARVRPSMPAEVAPQLTLLELRTLSLDLTMPLSVNNAWHDVPYYDEDEPDPKRRLKSRKVLTDEHRQFRSTTISLVRTTVGRNWAPLVGRIEMTVRLYYTNRRITDIDNRIKPLQDALTEAKVYRDDSQIDALHVYRIYGDKEKSLVDLREIGT